MNRIAAAAFCAVLLATAATWALADIDQGKGGSAFDSGSASILPGMAAELGLEAERLTAAPMSLVHDPAAPPATTIVAVVHPTSAYTSADRAVIERFVADGGLLLVADDHGTANSLVAAFGISFERVRLVETDSDWGWRANDQGPTQGLSLPAPTALLVPPGSTAHVLATSSGQSFLDRDGNGWVGQGDAVGPFVVAARIDHGAGRVILVADAQALEGPTGALNLAWWQDQVADAGPRSLLLIDESQSAQDPSLVVLATARSIGSSDVARLVGFALAAAALAAVLLAQAWDGWTAHAHRPLRFIRRSEVQERQAWSPRNQWTARGGLAIAAAVALSLWWALTGSPEAGLAGGVVLAALGVSVLSRVPALTASRTLGAERILEESALDVAIQVRRRFGRGEIDLLDRLPAEVQVVDGTPWVRTNPGRSLLLRYAVKPSVRGRQSIGPLVARRQDLLGLRVAEAIITDASAVEVAPRAQPIRRIPFGTRVPTTTLGPHRVNRAGDGAEFHALRAYQAGDAFRSVNWKASARSRSLMVNQRVHESMTRLVILLDARAVAGAGPAARTPFARSCRATLSVAAGILRMRDRVRVVAYGDGVQDLPVRSSVQQLHELTGFLAGAEPAGQTGLAEAVNSILPSLRAGCPVLVVSGFENDVNAAEALSSLRARGLHPWVLSPPPIAAPVDAQDGGPERNEPRITAERTAVLARIRAAGIPVFEVASEVPLDEVFLLGGAA
jgi:uncharacterized protein (DUF58 family)